MDLDDFATELWERLPSLADERGIVLDRDALPVPPATLETADLVVQRGGHYYGDCLVDSVGWYGTRPVLGRFALLLLASVLHDEATKIVLTLTDEGSDVRSVVIQNEHPARLSRSLRVRPVSIDYRPAPAERHPFLERRIASHDLPWLQLSSSRGVGMAHDHERPLRDTVFGFGSLYGTVLLAELLLDVSRPDGTCVEIELEGDGGFRGVAPRSAEMKIWLPGSVAWPPP